MNHIVVTRFMIGVSRPSSFRLRTRILLESAFPSMRAQTTRDFRWIVLTDEKIDRACEDEIRSAFSEFGHFHLIKGDFFYESVKSRLGHASVELFGTSKDVLMTRLDDDDALRTDYVDRAQARIGEVATGRVSYSHLRGVKVFPELGRHQAYTTTGASPGMTVRSPDIMRSNVFSSPHTRMHDRVRLIGGTGLLDREGEEPAFLVSASIGSDSRESKDSDQLRADARASYTISDEADAGYARLMASFGLPADFQTRIREINRKFVDTRPDLLPITVNDRPMTRLSMKSYYRAMKNEVLRSSRDVKDEKARAEIEVRLLMLKQAYYNI